MTKKLTKKELIAILVDDYGYEKDDIKMLTNAKLEGLIKQEEKDAKVAEVEDTIEVITEDTHIKDEDLISVMNGSNSELIHRSQRTGRMWKFVRFGQTDKMPFIELMSIYNSNPKCFEDGRLIVLNKQVAQNFGLTEIYKNIITPKNLDELFKKDVSELEEVLNKLPQSMKTTFVIRARELYTSNKLDSKKLIDFIQGYFGYSFDDNAPISDIVEGV